MVPVQIAQISLAGHLHEKQDHATPETEEIVRPIRAAFVLSALILALAACAAETGTDASNSDSAASSADDAAAAYTPVAPAYTPPVEVPTPEVVDTPAPKPVVKKATTTRTTSTTTTKKKASSSSTSSCDPNYKGACLKPNVSDYDCAGGSGNGPYYIDGPFQSVGSDPYDLDRDGDGIACE